MVKKIHASNNFLKENKFADFIVDICLGQKHRNYDNSHTENKNKSKENINCKKVISFGRQIVYFRISLISNV